MTETGSTISVNGPEECLEICNVTEASEGNSKSESTEELPLQIATTSSVDDNTLEKDSLEANLTVLSEDFSKIKEFEAVDEKNSLGTTESRLAGTSEEYDQAIVKANRQKHSKSHLLTENSKEQDALHMYDGWSYRFQNVADTDLKSNSSEKEKSSSLLNENHNFSISVTSESKLLDELPYISLQQVRNSKCSNAVKNEHSNHSEGLTLELLNRMVQRVIRMDAREQTALLKSLGILDLSSNNYIQPDLTSSEFNEKQKTAEEIFSASSEKQELESMQSLSSTITEESLTHDNKPVKVILELFSNWGHPSRIGLTEVQFLNWQGKKLEITHTEVQSIGAVDSIGELENLINGKTKTVKECHMWSCSLPQEKSVKIILTAITTSNQNNLMPGLAGIKIWNYNKSVKELNIGVKRMKITVNNKLIFDGNLHKGCGSQVFDYSQIIPVDYSELPSSEEYVTQYSQENTVEANRQNLPNNSNYSSDEILSYSLPHAFETEIKSKKSLETVEVEDVNMWPSYLSSSTRINLMSEVEMKDKEKSETNSPSATQSFPWLSPIYKKSDSQSELYGASVSAQMMESQGFDMKVQRERSVSSSAVEHREVTRDVITRPMSDNTERKPQWFESLQWPSSEKSKSSVLERPSWLTDSYVQASEEDTHESKVDNRSSSAISRPLDHDAFVDVPTLENRSDVLPLLEDSKQDRENSARFGRRSLKSISGNGVIWKDGSCTSRSRSGSDAHLEDSWSSLHAFEQNHKGRLDGSSYAEGDILDLYMQEEKVKRQNLNNKGQADASQYVQVLETDGTELVDLETDFIIPELPEGQHLRVNILTTWGDKHYVGLNGIEIFNHTGEPAEIVQIWAEPSDINVLPEYNNDPRVVSNLIDGIYRTHDDMHLWLAPYTPGSNHFIYLTFCQPMKVAMIRIWNYNKSRIHSFRGARHIEMLLDDKPIFKGEIARACGAIQGSTDAFGDTILFTTDDDILEAISHHDKTFSESINTSVNTLEETMERPRTADLRPRDERPFTSASINPPSDISNASKSSLNPWDQGLESGTIVGQYMTLTLVSTWGDYHCIGLTGLEILGVDDEIISILPHMVACTANNQNNEILRLFNGIYVTTEEDHMWYTIVKDKSPPRITITFDQPTLLNGLRLWNYNRSPEDAYTGVKMLCVAVDNNIISPPDGFTLRKAPGNCHFDYAQEINFSGPPDYYLTDYFYSSTKPFRGSGDLVIQDYESPVMPCGFIFQFQLLSTWGDLYYVGLNGIEAYDAIGRRIPLTENNIAAYPDSVNVLDNIMDDVRTPDKLIDGVNATLDGRHMWLAPILPGVLNRIYLIFDYPVTVSLLKLWNYAKTPTRGVKEFGLLVDDLLVYNGILKQAKSGVKNISHQTIIFTSDKEILRREKHNAIRYPDGESDVQLTNESSVLYKGNLKNADQALRPTTSVTPGASRLIIRQHHQ